MAAKLLLVPPGELGEVADRTAAAVEEEVSARLEVVRLRRALRTLPPLERRVIELHWGLDGGEELTLRQVAARLRMSVGRVFYLHRDGLTHLREHYGVAGPSAPALAEAA